jgi:hypothetical protein
LDRAQRPLFRRRESRVDEGLAQIDLAAIAEIFGEALQQPIESAASLPLLKPAMARLIRRIAPRQVRPRRAGAQHPQHPVQDGARIGPRPAATIRPYAWPKGRRQHGPLLVSEIHAATYDAATRSVTGPTTYL